MGIPDLTKIQGDGTADAKECGKWGPEVVADLGHPCERVESYPGYCLNDYSHLWL